MSLKNFHVDGNITDAEVMADAKVILNDFYRIKASRKEGFGSTWRSWIGATAAYGNVTSSSSSVTIKLHDADLNRVHQIVSEIDARRFFYECYEDEIPSRAMQSLYLTREKILDSSNGQLANHL